MPVISKSSSKSETCVLVFIAVVGLNNPNAFCIGDTIYTGPKRMFPGIPSFSPELFCYMRNPNPSKYKQFVKGLNELLGEGAVQVATLTSLCIRNLRFLDSLDFLVKFCNHFLAEIF